MQPIITPPPATPILAQPPRSLRNVRTLRSLAQRARQLGPAAIPLFTYAFALLLAARLALRLLPVARIIAWKQRPKRSLAIAPLSEPEAAATRARIRHAILTIARYSPIRFVCFPQCLAAAALLRAQGLSSRLHYGVTRDPAHGKLITHTWLESGNEILIGGEVADRYSTLAVY